ncbi:MAG: non-canonical purine pyrophosphatase, rdgB/HAM1 family [Thermoleophilia bacterium]|nr:non-canonical purine pyrophosphatase, rdgB/HAM1 family [Thermoleophilia bacterium]
MRSEYAPRRAVICTGNPHKVDELGELLAGVGLTFEPLPAGASAPEETGSTFVANARIKAVAGHIRFPERWVIADDSGLVVDALDGAPGVQSARFAGAHATDADNVELLLRRLRDVPDDARGARFACVLVAIAPNGDELLAEGFVEGSIARACRGASGFGYDPVFVPHGYEHTFAELGGDVKAQLSHRAHAAAALRDQLVTSGTAHGK